MNLLNFIDSRDLELLNLEFIDLHTRNYDKASEQCDGFFAARNWQGHYFTGTSDYCTYGGLCYSLKRSKSGTMFLIRIGEYEEY